MREGQREFIAKILELFVSYGIRSVTTNDIARELGISKKTLYEDFKDKSEIVAYTLNQLYEEMMSQIEEVKSKKQNAIDMMLDIFMLMKQLKKKVSPTLEYDLRKYYPKLAVEIHNRFHESIYQLHYDNIIQGQAEGLYREVDASIIAKLLSYRGHVGVHEVFTMEEIFSEKLHQELFLYHLYGVCNEKGYALLKKQDNRFNSNNLN
jgi:Transcriptional regulator